MDFHMHVSNNLDLDRLSQSQLQCQLGRYLGTYPAIGLDRSGLARPRWLPSLSGLALSKALPGLDVKAGQIKGEKRGLRLKRRKS